MGMKQAAAIRDRGVALWVRPLMWSLAMLIGRPRDSLVAIVAATAVGAILVNSLYLQPGPHPAPMFAFKPLPVVSDEPTGAVTAALPRPRPQDVAASQPVAAPQPVPAPRPTAHHKDPIADVLAGMPPAVANKVANVAPAAPAPPAPVPQSSVSAGQLTTVQRTLADFGYGPVAVTGVYGPDTRAAIERFERDRRLPVTGQVSDRLLRELAAMAN